MDGEVYGCVERDDFDVAVECEVFARVKFGFVEVDVVEEDAEFLSCGGIDASRVVVSL